MKNWAPFSHAWRCDNCTLWVLDGAIDAKRAPRPPRRVEPIAPPTATGLHAAMSFLASSTKKERPE